MAYGGQRPGFTEKARVHSWILRQSFVEELDGDESLEDEVLCQEDSAHPTLADQVFGPIAIDVWIDLD